MGYCLKFDAINFKSEDAVFKHHDLKKNILKFYKHKFYSLIINFNYLIKIYLVLLKH